MDPHRESLGWLLSVSVSVLELVFLREQVLQHLHTQLR